MAGITKEQVFEFIDNMTIVQMSEFIKEFEERYGVTAAATAVAAVVPMDSGQDEKPKEEEKTSFDAILASVGDKKIQVIKVVREITALGLKEAKDLVDNAPKEIKTGVTKEEAQAIKAKLEEQGATVEIK
ncbi:MAG: 50S ribosomal protein L7/L12 [Candidatus Magnetoovum sp. WYHC-5]|nr:50S ribosomal protein L7/L12 [Candidatus Magnetoovum sp. WYHC-5]